MMVLKGNYSQTLSIYPEFEAAGDHWTTAAKFEEDPSSDELEVCIQFRNEGGATRQLDMTLSKPAVSSDIRGKYRMGVIANIQGWLWSQQQRGSILYMGV